MNGTGDKLGVPGTQVALDLCGLPAQNLTTLVKPPNSRQAPTEEHSTQNTCLVLLVGCSGNCHTSGKPKGTRVPGRLQGGTGLLGRKEGSQGAVWFLQHGAG